MQSQQGGQYGAGEGPGTKEEGRTGCQGLSRCDGESKGLEGFVPGWQHSKVEKQLRLRYKNATGCSNSSTAAGLAMGSEDSDGLQNQSRAKVLRLFLVC